MQAAFICFAETGNCVSLVAAIVMLPNMCVAYKLLDIGDIQPVHDTNKVLAVRSRFTRFPFLISSDRGTYGRSHILLCHTALLQFCIQLTFIN